VGFRGTGVGLNTWSGARAHRLSVAFGAQDYVGSVLHAQQRQQQQPTMHGCCPHPQHHNSSGQKNRRQKLLRALVFDSLPTISSVELVLDAASVGKGRDENGRLWVPM
jgi:hypothetical protein